MTASAPVVVELALRFTALSLVAIGGISAILPEIHRVVVDVQGWMTSGAFADLFALAQLAPGPNAMFVSLVGWKVAGLPGALVATAAVCGPSSLLCYWVARWAERAQTTRILPVLRRALAPIAIGFILASGYTLAQGADRTPGALALTGVAAVALAFTRVNPVWILLVAAIAGATGVG